MSETLWDALEKVQQKRKMSGFTMKKVCTIKIQKKNRKKELTHFQCSYATNLNH